MSKLNWVERPLATYGFSGKTRVAIVYTEDWGEGFSWELVALQGSRHSFAKAGSRKTVTDAKRAAQAAWSRFVGECGLVSKDEAA